MKHLMFSAVYFIALLLAVCVQVAGARHRSFSSRGFSGHRAAPRTWLPPSRKVSPGKPIHLHGGSGHSTGFNQPGRYAPPPFSAWKPTHYNVHNNQYRTGSHGFEPLNVDDNPTDQYRHIPSNMLYAITAQSSRLSSTHHTPVLLRNGATSDESKLWPYGISSSKAAVSYISNQSQLPLTESWLDAYFHYLHLMMPLQTEKHIVMVVDECNDRTDEIPDLLLNSIDVDEIVNYVPQKWSKTKANTTQNVSAKTLTETSNVLNITDGTEVLNKQWFGDVDGGI